MKIFPEKFLYNKLPDGVTQEDAQGWLKSIVGGLQDRLEDLRALAQGLSTFMDPATLLPIVDNNALSIKYQSDGEDGYVVRKVDPSILDSLAKIDPNKVQKDLAYLVVGGESVSYNGTTYAAGDTFTGVDLITTFTAAGSEMVYEYAPLLTLVVDTLDIEESLVSTILLETDSIRATNVAITHYLADTIGSTLYSDTVSEQKKAVASYFSRLKIRGVPASYDELGRLLGYDDVVRLVLWSRLSPRIANDVGNPSNDLDFNAASDFKPALSTSVAYDPADMTDGPYYEWSSIDLSSVSTDLNFYTEAINGASPFIKVATSATTVVHPADGTYTFSGGDYHKKASVTPSGSGLTFSAVGEGSSFNGMTMVVSTSAGGKKIKILWRLSSIKYRSSYFDLLLGYELDRFNSLYPPVPVTSNKDVEAIGGTAPFRPISGPTQTQALGSELQLDTRSLASASSLVSSYFEELRVGTRFPRRTGVGVSKKDDVEYAPFLNKQIIADLTASPSGYATTLPDGGGGHTEARLYRVVRKDVVLSRGFVAQPLRLISADGGIDPFSVRITDTILGTLAQDDGYGKIIPSSIYVSSGTVDYTTGAISVVATTSLTQLTVAANYTTGDELIGEESTATPGVVTYILRDTNSYVEATVNFNTQFYSVQTYAPIPNFDAWKIRYEWVPNVTEVIRTEPSSSDKTDKLVTYEARPEDEPSTLLNFEVTDAAPWARGTTLLVDADADSYDPAVLDVSSVQASDTLTLLDHRGIEYDLFGFEPSPDMMVTPIRTVLVEREGTPGLQALAMLDGVNYQVGVAHGVMVADLASFFSRAHHHKLVGWLPLNEHVCDDLAVNDKFLEIKGQLTSIQPSQRLWDDERGWYLNMKPGSSFTVTANRSIVSDFTLTFWLKPSTVLNPLPPDEILSYGPMSIRLSNDDPAVVSIYWKTTTANQLVGTLTLINGWNFIHVMKEGSVVTYGSGTWDIPDSPDTLFTADDGTYLLTDSGDFLGIPGSGTLGSSGSYLDFGSADTGTNTSDPANSILVVSASDRSYGINDLRMWKVAKTSAEINQVRNYGYQATDSTAPQPYFRGVGKNTKWGLTPVLCGFVYPSTLDDSRLSPTYDTSGIATGSNLLRAGGRRLRLANYDTNGRYVADNRFIVTGLGGGQQYPTTWQLGTRYYQLNAGGHVVMAGVHSVSPKDFDRSQKVLITTLT